MGTTYVEQQKLYAMNCYKCGIFFAVPGDFDDRRRVDQESFYCPSGHRQGYCESDLQEVKNQLAAQKRRTEYMEAQRDRERQEKQAIKRRLSAQKGVVTKLKKRSAHGVCPCCSRTFKQLKRHMDNKHPEFVQVNK